MGIDDEIDDEIDYEDIILNIPLSVWDIYVIWVACENSYAKVNENAKEISKHGSKGVNSLKSLIPLDVNKPEKYIDTFSESALKMKNVMDKFESIIRETEFEDVIKSMEEIQKSRIERTKKFSQL
jgi:hypothetical protein